HHPDVRVTPAVRIQRPDVVAADEADAPVHHEDLAVVASGAADVDDRHPRAQDGEAQHVDVPGKALELRGHDEVGEPVVDDAHQEPTVRRADHASLIAWPTSSAFHM